jgi:hypothetical protein
MSQHQQERTPELTLVEVRATGIWTKTINQMVAEAPDGALIKAFRFNRVVIEPRYTQQWKHILALGGGMYIVLVQVGVESVENGHYLVLDLWRGLVFVARDYIISIPTDLETDEDHRLFFAGMRIRAPLEVLLVQVKATEVHRTSYNTPEHYQASEEGDTASGVEEEEGCGGAAGIVTLVHAVYVSVSPLSSCTF